MGALTCREKIKKILAIPGTLVYNQRVVTLIAVKCEVATIISRLFRGANVKL